MQTRASLGLPPAVILDGRNPATIVESPRTACGKRCSSPATRSQQGEPVGRLWFIDRPDRPAELLRAPMDGVVAVTKAIAPTEQGDCVFVLGEPIDRSALL